MIAPLLSLRLTLCGAGKVVSRLEVLAWNGLVLSVLLDAPPGAKLLLLLLLVVLLKIEPALALSLLCAIALSTSLRAVPEDPVIGFPAEPGAAPPLVLLIEPALTLSLLGFPAELGAAPPLVLLIEPALALSLLRAIALSTLLRAVPEDPAELGAALPSVR